MKIVPRLACVSIFLCMTLPTYAANSADYGRLLETLQPQIQAWAEKKDAENKAYERELERKNVQEQQKKVAVDKTMQLLITQVERDPNTNPWKTKK